MIAQELLARLQRELHGGPIKLELRGGKLVGSRHWRTLFSVDAETLQAAQRPGPYTEHRNYSGHEDDSVILSESDLRQEALSAAPAAG